MSPTCRAQAGQKRKVPLKVILNVNHTRGPNLYQKPAEMSPTFAVKGKESGTARILGSGTSGMCPVTNISGRSKFRLRAQSPLHSGNYRNR